MTGSAPMPGPAGRDSKLFRRALAACLFLIVLGSRWAVVGRAGTDVPEWDQWDAEGAHLLLPWFQHRLEPRAFLDAHNEHRPALTLLVNFGLAVGTGQWDQRVQAVVNALIPGVIAAALYLFGCRRVGRRWRAPLFILLAAAYALPLAWQNVLGGFHSAQFMLIGTAFAAVALLPLSRPGSGPWWAGAAGAVLALGTMASGFFAAATAAALVLFRLLRRESAPREALTTIAFCAAVTAAGWFARVPVAGHEPLMAHGAGDFLTAAGLSLRWPGSGSGWWAVLLWLPWAWLAARLLRTRAGQDLGGGLVVAGLGLWVLLQVLATAYARGAGGAPPASRYIDTLVFGSVANGIALGWLWRDCPGRRGRRVLAVAGIAWMSLFAAGTATAARDVFRDDLPRLRVHHRFSEQNTRNFVATGDEAYLRHEDIPYPDHSLLASRLRIPELRAILPASVREPIRLQEADGGGGFTRHEPVGAGPAPGAGLPPDIPMLPSGATWGSFGARAGSVPLLWMSRPLAPAGSGWLKFEIAGDLGRPGTALELKSPDGTETFASVRTDRPPGVSWRSAYVREPGRAFIVAASVSENGRWFAFSEPALMSPASHWALRAVRMGLSIALVAALAAAILGAAGARRDEAPPANP